MKKIFSIFILIFALLPTKSIATTVGQLRDDGIMLYSLNKIEEAKNAFEQIPDEKKDAEVLLLLSNIAQDMQDTQKVEELLLAAIKEDPKYYKAYYNLGNLYFNNGKIDDAMKNYKQALKYNNKNSYIYTNLACCYLAKNSLGMAKYYFNKAADLNPQNPNNYYNLAFIYKQKNNIKKANELLKIYNDLMAEKIN